MKNINLFKIVSVTCVLLMFFSSALGQSPTEDEWYTFNLDNEQKPNQKMLSLEKLLKQIESEQRIVFLYKTNWIKDKFISASILQQDSLEYKLGAILQNEGLTYSKITDRSYAIRPQAGMFAGTKGKEAIQLETVSGEVIDATSGDPLPGVNVVVKGTTTGTATDREGRYELAVLSLQDTLVFSFIGYQTRQVPINGRTNIDVTLQAQAVTGEELVVVGYGTQQKENLTSPIETVDAEDLENRPVKSLSQMLSASVAGLNVDVSSGAPDAEPSLNIRGFTGFNSTGQPLVLVDGVPQDIKFVDPNNVESISVLKDAAASAIYGSRAPNGVVLITTKSGERGEKMQIDFSTDLIVNRPLGLPDAASGYEYAIHRNDRRYNSQRSPLYSDATLERIQQYIAGEITTTNIVRPNGKYGTVWQYNASVDHLDRAFRDNVFNQKYNLSISGGGGEETTYYASLGHVGNQGVYDSEIDWMKRYSGLIKVNTDITDWFSAGVSTKFGRQESQRPNIWRQGQSDATLFTLLGFPPTLPVYNDNGWPNEFSIIPNLHGLSGSFNTTTSDLWLTGQMELTPVDGLSIKGDYTWNEENQFDNNPQFVFGTRNADGTPMASRRSPTRDEMVKRSHRTNYYNINLTATYDLDVDKHSLTLLGGFDQELNKFQRVDAVNTQFYTQSVPSLSTTYGSESAVGDRIFAWATRGYFGRVSYNYRETYLLDFNARYDASSKYSPDSRWAFFPSVSAGYNIANENFWPLKEYVDMFKIKGSWGRLGSNQGNNYAYLPTMGLGNQTPVILDGGRLPFVTMPGIIPSDLTWVKPRTIDFGLEVGAFNNRLNITYDWYQRTVFDQQGPAEQFSEVLGTAPPRSNNAVSETRGWEFSVKWRDEAFNLKGSSVSYSVRAGVSDYIGYVVEYESNETGTRSGWTPGQVFGKVYGFTSAGIAERPEAFQNQALWRGGWYYPGDILYADTNGDGLVNHGQGNFWYAQGDRKSLGYNYPRYKYHIALRASWKGFSLSALFDGVGKQTVYVANRFHLGTKNFLTAPNYERGYWSYNDQDAYFPRAYDRNHWQLFEDPANDQYATNLAHLRIKNINLSYSVPAELVSKIDVRSLEVNLSAENVGMVYNKAWAKEYDPIQFEQGISTYPPSRSFSLGVKVGF